MKKLYTFFLALSVCSISFPQISEITRLPVQNQSQSIKESAPVWLSENEIMIFYVNETKDTIFSTKSNDRGLNWEQSKFEFKIDSLLQTQELIYPAALTTTSGRLMFAWSVIGEGIHLLYSDDKGSSWSQQQIIIGTGSIPAFQKRLYNIHLSQLEDERLILCFNPANDRGTLYYKYSSDDGVSWSDSAKKILRDGYLFDDHSIISTGSDSLICVFKLQKTLSSGSDIYARYSYDNGETWGDTVNISGYESNVITSRVTKTSNGSIYLAYPRKEIINFPFITNFAVGDIFYRKSTDGGLTWGDEKQFTHYIGDDNIIALNSSGQYPFISYSSLKFTGTNQIAFGILDETEESFTPPYLFDSYSLWSNDPDSASIRALVKDDVGVKSVKFSINDPNQIYQLYDDGLHQDLAADDGVFGNKISFDIAKTGSAIYFNVNKVKIPFSNDGIIADVQVRDTSVVTFILEDIQNNNALMPKRIWITIGSLGRYEENYFLFSSGFFLSGISNGLMWSNAVAPSSLVEDYLAGTVNSNPEDPIFDFYVVKKDDTPFGNSWQNWKDAVSLGAEFYDGDGDGIYNPVDKNWNGTWDENEDMPMLIGDETAWCVYNDGLPANQRRWQSEPQGIEVRQTIFATDQPELENVIFIRYSILNTGTVVELIDSVYFGVWEDSDLGSADDDLVGCDTLLNSGFYYNDGEDFLYGENPPSFFTTYLQGPIVNTDNPGDSAKNNFGELIGSHQISSSKNLNMTSHIFNRGGDPWLGDPNNATHARCYLLGRDKQCNIVNPCTFPYCQVRGGVNCNDINPLFWASGDPVTDYGWILVYPADERNLISTGPFKLEKDKPQDIIIAYVMGRGTDPLNSITVARENVQRAIQEYESNFETMTYSAPPPTNPVTSYVLYQNYPNPFNPATTIRYELPQDGVVTIDIFDILGQKVKTLLNEFKKADRYEVRFNSTGLASGVYIYQMRVNDFITSKKMVLVK
jgi:hypothetical protein